MAACTGHWLGQAEGLMGRRRLGGWGIGTGAGVTACHLVTRLQGYCIWDRKCCTKLVHYPASQMVWKFLKEKVTSNKQIFRELLTWQIVTPHHPRPKCTWLSSCPQWWRRMTGCQDGQEDAGHEFSGVRSPEWTLLIIFNDGTNI